MLSLTNAIFVGIVVVVSVDFTFSGTDDKINHLLEELRARMHMDMSDTLGIPRLDPFTVDFLHLDSKQLGDIGAGE